MKKRSLRVSQKDISINCAKTLIALALFGVIALLLVIPANAAEHEPPLSQEVSAKAGTGLANSNGSEALQVSYKRGSLLGTAIGWSSARAKEETFISREVCDTFRYERGGASIECRTETTVTSKGTRNAAVAGAYCWDYKSLTGCGGAAYASRETSNLKTHLNGYFEGSATYKLKNFDLNGSLVHISNPFRNDRGENFLMLGISRGF